jgi:hypothetical protein
LIVVGGIENNTLFAWAIRFAEYGLLRIDLALLIGAVGKPVRSLLLWIVDVGDKRVAPGDDYDR